MPASPLLLGLLLLVGRHSFAAQSISPSESTYRLHVSDVIQVAFHLTPELDATVTIQPDGFATIPNIGSIKLSDLSLAEATASVTRKADERLNHPDLTLTLKDFERPHFFVGGQVGKPGKYILEGPTSAIQAVQVGGGFKDSAAATHVLLLHPLGDGVAETHILDLGHINGNNRHDPEVAIANGDVLLVKENTFTKVSRYVKLLNPGIYVPLYR